MSGLWGDGGAYQTWVEFLRRWAEFEPVDPAALPVISEEQYDGVTIQRLTVHLGKALDQRLRSWADKLGRAMSAAPDEFSYGRELAQARAGLQAVRAMAGHPGLPRKLREAMTDLVDRQLPQAQDQLERFLDDAVRRGDDPRAVERLRRALRDNALTGVVDQGPPPAPSAAAPDPWAYDPAAAPRRRVIPD
ncbi:hypothetical protein [Streptomyces sp. MZ04]|uniref:hypothetical protein n=1 Tax=Streptomyces sp. MZ04 TaxID=2559236 RepID=UPI00107E67F9|nr:hypothetical protein [Streptomyces sp. MZ04]TGA85805.1 hypothetical protein E2651_41605 [Streptomyces sp. MZ04]